MRVAITKTGHFTADFYCSESKDAKRILKEKHVSVLAIDFPLKGRETGCDIIDWAGKNKLLPNYVILIERSRIRRALLGEMLKVYGFRTNDDTTFIKH